MKLFRLERFCAQNKEILASFGQARLIKDAGGRVELRGGSAAEQTAAKEWISLFMHEAVPGWGERRRNRLNLSIR